jgi:uncharacterized protein (TIGR02246 family)
MEPISEADRIKQIIEGWAAAVRRRDLAEILAHHADDMLMFDVPPPLRLKGLRAYEESWDQFYSWSTEPVVFDILEMDATAGTDVAFAAALMRCRGRERDGIVIDLDFRLTVGLRKIDGEWTITHEHHSIPAST